MEVDRQQVNSFSENFDDFPLKEKEFKPSCQELAMQGEKLSKEGDYSEAIPVLEAALESGTEDLQLASVLWSLLGNAHFYQGDYNTAIVCHSHDLSICCETCDEKSKAQAYCNLGIAHRKSGYLKKARLCYESYLEICEQLEDRRSISKANHNLGDLHMTLGRLKLQRDGGLESSPEGRDDLSEAAMYFEKHLEYIQDQGSKAAECRAHGNLGVIYELLQNTDKAIEHHQKRLDLALELADKNHIGKAYCSIGNCLRAILQPDKAMECYKRGLGVATEVDDQTGIGVCQTNIATTFELLGNLEESANQNELSFQAMKSAGNIHGQLSTLTSLVKTYETLAVVSKTVEALQKLAFLYRELKNEDKMKEALSEIARLGGAEPEIQSTAAATSSSTKADKKGAGSSGGIFKKLKEKRQKKRSVIGPETSMSVSGIIESTGAWRSDSPGLKEEKKTKKGMSKEKLNILTIPEQEPPKSRSESVSSKDESSTTVSPVVKNSPPRNRKRSWSHGNISKVPDGEAIHLSAIKLSQFSESSESSIDPNSSTDQYVIHGPSSVDLLGIAEEFQHRKPLYDNYGGETHKETLRELKEFLDTADENEPMDLRMLQDWDGWVIGSKEIKIHSTKESKLI